MRIGDFTRSKALSLLFQTLSSQRQCKVTKNFANFAPIKQTIMEDFSQEPCPMGGKHELVLLMNVYTVTCGKCGKSWTRHIDDVLGKNHKPNDDSSSKSDDVG